VQQEPVDEDHPRRGRGQTLERVEERLLNPPGDDPGVILRLVGLGRTLLFDLGEHQLPTAELLEVSDLFVSHAHIDHFIGFDHLLRLHLGGGSELTVYGPGGITAHVRGRLQGYAWNLVADSPLRVVVCEVSEGQARWTIFPCCQRFAEQESWEEPHQGYLELPGAVRVRFAWLEHGVDCLAWVLEEPQTLAVDPQALRTEALPPGPWLTGLKERVAAGDLSGHLPVAGDPVPVADLARRLLRTRPGRRYAYVTDTAFNKKSVAALRRVASGVDALWCEAAYLHEQRDRARANLHLTARQAGRLAAELKVGRLHLFHFSRRYQGQDAPHLAEARQVFAQTEPAPRYVAAGG